MSCAAEQVWHPQKLFGWINSPLLQKKQRLKQWKHSVRFLTECFLFPPNALCLALVSFWVLSTSEVYAQKDISVHLHKALVATSTQPDSVHFYLEKHLAEIGTSNPHQWYQAIRQVGLQQKKQQPLLAVELFETYIAQSISNYGSNDTITALLTGQLARTNTHDKIARYDIAVLHYEKALEIYRHHKIEHLAVAHIYRYCGTAFLRLGNFQKAPAYLEKALHIYEQFEKPNYLARASNDLASHYFTLGQQEKTIFYCDKVLNLPEVTERLRARAMANKGNALLAAQKSDEAIAIATEALSIFERLKSHRDQSTVHRLLGLAHQKNQAFEQAMKHLLIAYSLGQMVYGSKHRETAKQLMALVELNHTMLQHDQALRQCQRALIALFHTFNDSLLTSNPNPEDFYGEPWIMTALHKKAQLLTETGQLSLALETFELAMKQADLLRQSYQFAGSKEFLSTNSYSLFGHTIENCIGLFEQTGDTAYLNKAFTVSERGKSAIFAEFLNELQAKHKAGVPHNLLQRERVLKQQLADVEKQLRDLAAGANSDVATVRKLKDQLLQLRLELELFAKSLEQKYPYYFRLKFDVVPITLNKVRDELLEQNSALLSYFVADKFVYLFAISSNDFLVERIGNTTDIEQQTNIFTDQLKNPIGSSNDKLAYASQTLYKQLIGPATALLHTENSAISRLIIVPDGVLNYLPFEALSSTNPNNLDGTARHYLIEQFSIHYNYSVRAMSQMRSEKNAPFDRCLAIAPTFDGSQQTNSDNRQNGFSKLNFNEDEVRQIAKSIDTDMLLGKEASEESFKNTASDYDIIHLATHALLSDDHPMNSRLVFAQASSQTDNALFAYEIYNMQLNARMAVLSACNTGQGKLIRGEGPMSLAKAFMFAGCPSVTMSLWPVNDKATQQLMAIFYQGLSAGKTKDAALRQAKLTYLKQADQLHQHPFFWAGFITTGNPEAIVVNGPFSSFWTIGFALGVLLLAIFIWRRRH